MNILHDYKKEIFDLEKINQLALNDPIRLIEDSEQLYQKQIGDIVHEIAAKGNYKFILLAGPSSSGKTTTSNFICKQLSEQGFNSLVISLDDFYLNLESRPKLPNGEYDLESVSALDLDYINKFVNDLFEKSEALMPKYNFKTGKREQNYSQVKITPNTIVIMEGIHALNPIMFKKHNEAMYRIYICVNSNFELYDKIVMPAQQVRLMRRLIRDFSSRGSSFERTFKMWQNVLAGEDLYIKPYKNTADYLINSTHAYEPLMYAKKLLPLLKNEQSEQANAIVNMLNKCETLSVDLLPANSLLHEFLD